jgi:hypothetical protein
MKPEHSEYEAGVLTTRPRRSVHHVCSAELCISCIEYSPLTTFAYLIDHRIDLHIASTGVRSQVIQPRSQ